MKKSNLKKLTLSRETVRCLEADRFPQVQGGVQPLTSPSACFSGGEDCCFRR
jgi:hypothetical protein